MEECVFSGDDESQMTSVSYTPRSGEFELNENYIILESDDKSSFRSKCNSFDITANFFCRILSLVYFISFISSINQVVPLFGSDGIYDIYSNTATFLSFLSDKSFYEALSEFPSLFLIIPISNFTLKLVPLIGCVSSFLMFLTGFNCMYSFLFLWILKLSTVALFKTLPKTVPDLLLLEVGFLSIFLFSPFKFFDKHANLEVPPLVSWSFRFLVYRVILLSGVYKVFLLKKVDIQHILMSVPLPTFFNYYLVGLVSNFKFFNVVFTCGLIFFEVVLSVFVITPYRNCRIFGGVATVIYSILFCLMGNFGPFYLLLLLCSLFCLDDQFLHNFANWRYNPFCKTDNLMRKVSVDLVDNIFDNYPNIEKKENELEDPENSGEGEENVDENSFGGVYLERILSNLNYNRHRECIREFVDVENKLPESLCSDFFRRVIKDALLLLYLILILSLTILLFLFPRYKGLKAFVLFVICVLLKSHCEAVNAKMSHLQGEYTLFVLQALLLFEMVKNGPNTWSFFLWIALVELQLSLSKRMDNLNQLAKMIIQSFLLIHLVIYNTKIFHSSFKEVLFKPNRDMGLTNQRIYESHLNSFYSINNYKNVFPVNSLRYEVVFEGTTEGIVTSKTYWEEYEFKRKPSKLDKFPHFVPLYQYKLDQMLVSSFNTNYYANFDKIHGRHNSRNNVKEKLVNEEGRVSYEDRYVLDIIRMLLVNSERVGDLMKNPFEKGKPKYVKVSLYRYFFTSLPNMKKKGKKNWYYREFVTQLVPPVSYTPIRYNATTSNKVKRVGKDAISSFGGENGVGALDKEGLRSNQWKGESYNVGDRNEVIHVVHTIPPADHKGVPLEMADSFNHKVPKIDGIVIASK